jgi:hypothetical protein
MLTDCTIVQRPVPREWFATHSAVSPHAADGCIARMMRKPHAARLASDAALLLLSGVGLLVCHEGSRPLPQPRWVTALPVLARLASAPSRVCTPSCRP